MCPIREFLIPVINLKDFVIRALKIIPFQINAGTVPIYIFPVVARFFGCIRVLEHSTISVWI